MKKISVQSEINIAQDIDTVFNYFSDLRNDPFWRKEAISTILDTDKIGLNTVIKQDSFLSKRVPHYFTTFVCTIFEPKTVMICETDSEQKFWSKSERRTEFLAPKLTKVLYVVEFDAAFIKHGLGFELPNFITQLFLMKTIKDYLTLLKKNLEN